MRRRVRGTVSGIYMYSAALRRGSKRRHGSALARVACNKTGFVRFFFGCKILHKSRTSRAWLTYASALALRALRLSLDNLTMINGSIVKRHAGR